MIANINCDGVFIHFLWATSNRNILGSSNVVRLSNCPSLCERVQFLRVSVNSGNAMLGSPAGVILPAKKKAQTPSSFPLSSIPNPHNPWLTQPFCVFYPVGDFTSFLNPCLPFLLPPSHFPPWVLSQAWLQASRTIHQQQQLPQWRPPNPSTHSTSASKSPLEFSSLKFSC